jgi:hypothetical protein
VHLKHFPYRASTQFGAAETGVDASATSRAKAKGNGRMTLASKLLVVTNPEALSRGADTENLSLGVSSVGFHNLRCERPYVLSRAALRRRRIYIR